MRQSPLEANTRTLGRQSLESSSGSDYIFNFNTSSLDSTTFFFRFLVIFIVLLGKGFFSFDEEFVVLLCFFGVGFVFIFILGNSISSFLNSSISSLRTSYVNEFKTLDSFFNLIFCSMFNVSFFKMNNGFLFFLSLNSFLSSIAINFSRKWHFFLLCLKEFSENTSIACLTSSYIFNNKERNFLVSSI
jgi:hypothetical protein